MRACGLRWLQRVGMRSLAFPDQGLNSAPRVGKQILTRCATREAPGLFSGGLDGSSIVFSEGGRVTQILLICLNS